MRTTPSVALLALLVLAIGGGAAGGEAAPIEAALAWESGPLTQPRAMFLPLGGKLPADLTPPAGVGKPLAARIRWGEGRGLAFVLDATPGRERLWIDRDLDATFAADGAGVPESVGWASGPVALQHDLEVAVVYEDEEARVPVRLLRGAGWDVDRVRIQPLVHRFGYVELEGRLRAVALVDGNADLRFGENEHDLAFLDLDGDGELDLRTEGGERVVPGEAVRVGDAGYVLEVPRVSGALVRLERAKTTPPARPREWKPVGRVTAGYRPPPPDVPFDEVLGKLEAERELAYASRYLTIDLLGRFGTPAAFERLDRLVRDDKDLAVRAAAARAMGNAAFLDVGGDRVIALTRDPTPGVAMGAVDALHRMDHPRREEVYRRLLREAPDAVAGRAATNLAYLGTAEALATVRRAWEDASTGSLRYAIYQGLRTAEGGPAVEVARRAAADDYAPLRAMALQDLRILDPDAARAAARDAAAVRPVNIVLGRAVIDLLAADGDGASVALLLDLAADLPAQLESHLAERLSPLRGEDAVAALVDALRHDAASVRRLAAQTLAGIVRPEVTKALLARVRRERDETVLAALLEALGDQGDPAAIAVLLKKARTRDDAVRRAAIRALARVGMGDAKVRKALLKLLDARDWEDRVLAVDAVAASGDPDLADELPPLLDDAHWQVRLAAVQAAGALRARASIEPLIERLEREEEPRVRAAVARALFRITHQHFYDEVAVWRDWWSKQDAAYAPPEGPPPERSREPGHTGPGFYGIPLDSDRVIFVIDQSGSMSAADAKAKGGGTRLDVALKEVRAALDGMGDRDRANVILFHTTVHPWRDRLQRLTKRNRHELIEHLDGQQPMGGTNLYDALEEALRDEEVDTIFLLSDGAPGAGRYVAKDDILRAVRRLNQTRRIRIHTIAIGMASDLMRELAEENGGLSVQR